DSIEEFKPFNSFKRFKPSAENLSDASLTLFPQIFEELRRAGSITGVVIAEENVAPRAVADDFFYLICPYRHFVRFVLYYFFKFLLLSFQVLAVRHKTYIAKIL